MSRTYLAIADAFADAAAEALENVRRHAGTDHAELALHSDPERVRVAVADHGRGFRPVAALSAGFGLREAITGRMKAAGGEAVIQSSPGEGSTVWLEWRHG